MLTKTLLFFTLLYSTCLAAFTNYVSIVAKPSGEDNNWYTHLIHARQNDNEELITSHCSLQDYDAQDLKEFLQYFIAEHQDPIEILYDSHNFSKNIEDLKNELQLGENVSFVDIRSIVRDSIGKNESKKSIEAKFKYIVHSHPLWQNRRNREIEKVDAFDLISSLNFEQIRAYFYAKQILEPSQNDPVAAYKIKSYTGREIGDGLYPGYLTTDDAPLILDGHGNGLWVSSNPHQLVVDIVQKGENSVSIYLALSKELSTFGKKDYMAPWWHDNVSSLLTSKNEFFEDFVNYDLKGK